MRHGTVSVLILAAISLSTCAAEEGAQDASTGVATAEPSDTSRAPDASPDQPDAGTATADAGSAGAGEAEAMDACPNSAGLSIVASELRRLKADLDAREMDLVAREQRINLLEETIGTRSVDLTKLRKEADALLSLLKATPGADDPDGLAPKEVPDPAANAPSAERELRLSHLADTLKGMRASSSAGVLASMEREEDAVDLLTRMNARQAAGILGAMPSGKAAVLAQRMLGARGPEAITAPAQGEPR
jgi:flagellar motility protein MotE (MotC chaperone)